MTSARGARLVGSLRYPCKTCKAKRGERCRTKSGLLTAAPHVSRQYAYMRSTGALQNDPQPPR